MKSSDTISIPSEQPTLAVLDADIMAYHMAYYADTEGTDTLEEIVESAIESWTPPGCTKVVLAFSCSRGDNFRRRFWPDYKAHRDTSFTPSCLGQAKRVLKEHGDVIELDNVEADDLMGIMTSMGSAVCVTTDKDLKQIPGWHSKPTKTSDPNSYYSTLVAVTPTVVTLEEADRAWITQWISGDATDNFSGIPGLGPAKAAKKLLDVTDPQNWVYGVSALYETHNLTESYCLAMAACARILRCTDWDSASKTPKINDSKYATLIQVWDNYGCN